MPADTFLNETRKFARPAGYLPDLSDTLHTHFSVLSNIIVNNPGQIYFVIMQHHQRCVHAAAQKNFHKNHSLRKLALTLFMLRILANYSDTTFSLDDFAFLANGFYRWSYFHRKNPPFTSFVLLYSSTTGFWCGKMPKNKAFLVPDLTNLPKPVS